MKSSEAIPYRPIDAASGFEIIQYIEAGDRLAQVDGSAGRRLYSVPHLGAKGWT